MNKEIVNTYFKDIVTHTFKKIFISRKGLSWLGSFVTPICLNVYLIVMISFLEVEKIKYIFYIIIACMIMQLITLGIIVFDKIKVSINK